MATKKSAQERQDEYIAEQEVLNRLGRTQSGAEFPAVLPTWEDLAKRRYAYGHEPQYGVPDTAQGSLAANAAVTAAVLSKLGKLPPKGSVASAQLGGQIGNAVPGLATDLVQGSSTPYGKLVEGYSNPLDETMGQVNYNRAMDDLDRLQEQANTRTGLYADVAPSIPYGKPDVAWTPQNIAVLSEGLNAASEGASVIDTARTNAAAATTQRQNAERSTGAATQYQDLVNSITSPQGPQFSGPDKRVYVGDKNFVAGSYDKTLDYALSKGISPDSITPTDTGYMIKDYTPVAQSNAMIKLKATLARNRVIGTQELADLIKATYTASSTYGKTPEQQEDTAYETALRLNELQRERIKTMSPADFRDYGDAFHYAQLNGMNMSEALKFASDWSKIAQPGAPSNAPRESGLYEAPSGKAPAASAERWAAESATHKLARDVAQRVQEGIKARQAPASAPAPATATAPAPRKQESDSEIARLTAARLRREAAPGGKETAEADLASLHVREQEMKLETPEKIAALQWAVASGLISKADYVKVEKLDTADKLKLMLELVPKYRARKK